MVPALADLPEVSAIVFAQGVMASRRYPEHQYGQVESEHCAGFHRLAPLPGRRIAPGPGIEGRVPVAARLFGQRARHDASR